MSRLQGKYALITGASQGLGLQLAIEFARQRTTGVAIVARGAELLQKAHDLIREAAPETKVLTIVADLSQPQDIERIVATTLNEFEGHLDILVNNASELGPSPMPFLLDYPLEDFHNVLNTNLIAPFLLIKKVLPAMIRKRRFDYQCHQRCRHYRLSRLGRVWNLEVWTRRTVANLGSRTRREQGSRQLG